MVIIFFILMFDSSVFEAMEPMSKGIHRALVPVESQLDHISGVELTEASPGYHMLTQTDLVEYLHTHSKELDFMTNTSVSELGAVHSSVFAAPSCMKVMDVVKCMRNASLRAVAIVESTPDIDKEPMLAIVSIRANYQPVFLPVFSVLHDRWMNFVASQFYNL